MREAKAGLTSGSRVTGAHLRALWSPPPPRAPVSAAGRHAAPATSAREAELVLITPRFDAVTLLTWYVFLLMLIPSALVVGPLGAAGAPAALLAAILLCCYLLARQHPATSGARARQPVRTAAMLFCAAVLAAYVSANRATLPAAQVNGADRAILVLAGWLGVLLLAADGIDRPDRLFTLLRRVVLGATIIALLGIVEFFTRIDLAQYVSIPGLTTHGQVTDLMNRDGLVRVTATAAQPLELAAILVMSLPLAIHQARFALPGQSGRRWMQVAVITVTIPMTVSRTAILGLAMVGAVLLPSWPRRDRRRAYLVTLTSVALVWMAKPSILSGFGSLFGQIGSDQSSRSRTSAYAAAGPYVTHHPWLGQGFGTFFPQTYFFVDNQYLTALIEIGIVGLAALVSLFVAAWLTARSARQAAADAKLRDLAQCLAAAVLAAAVCFFTFDALSFSIASGLCFLLIGCAGAAWRLARPERPPALRWKYCRRPDAGLAAGPPERRLERECRAPARGRVRSTPPPDERSGSR